MDLQKIAAAFIVGINLVTPFLVRELFPYSSFPMFSEVYTSYQTIEVLDEKEENVERTIQSQYLGVPQNLPFAIRPRPSLKKFGDEVADNELRKTLSKGKKVIIRKYGQRKDGRYGQKLKREVTVE